MNFIGIVSDTRTYENIRKTLKGKQTQLIHINNKSIDNIKNIKFDTIIIDSEIDNLRVSKYISEKIILNTKCLIINTDINIDLNSVYEDKVNVITYGLNQKATITISSIKDGNILICIQQNIKNKNKNTIEMGERLIKVGEDSKLKTYEIMIIYIINLLNIGSIINQTQEKTNFFE